MGRLHHGEQFREELALDLDEIARAGARRMLAEALEAEVADYIEAARGQQDEQGHALVVRKTATPESARSSAGPDRWRSRPRGSTTSGWTRTATAAGSRA